MGFRAVIAAIFSILAVVAGAAAIVNFRGAILDDVFANLLFQGGEGSFWCSVALWGSLAAFLFSIVFAYATFIVVDDDDTRRRPLPWIVTPIVMVLGFVAFWCSLGCKPAPSQPVSVAAPVEEVEDLPEPPADFDLPVTEESEVEALPVLPPVPVAPAVLVRNTSSPWPYKMPIIDAPSQISRASSAAFVSTLLESERAMMNELCGAEWVAVVGSSSQEGPATRNAKRAKLRASMVAEGLLERLRNESACDVPVVLGVSLGQHQAVLSDVGDTGLSTGYQRQVQFIVQNAAEAPGDLTARQALQAWLEEDENHLALVGSRAFSGTPVIFDPIN